MSDAVDMVALGFSPSNFCAGSIEYTVYRLHNDVTHPPIVVVHELPSMTVQCVRLAQKLQQASFTVHLPLLFGKPGDDKHWMAAASLLVRGVAQS